MFNSIPEIIEDIRRGRMVIVVDDDRRENEGDLVMAASFASAKDINFMARYGRGIICVPMSGERLDELELHPMVIHNVDPLKTAWTLSVDAREGITTGISAHDRARTIKVLIDPDTRPEDIIMPGHIFPLRAKEGGVLVRAGHTEAAVDLARLAGLEPAGVICEIMNDDGTMARYPDLIDFAKRHSLKMCAIAELIEYRRKRERLIKKVLETALPTRYGKFKLMLYESLVDGSHHIALVMGDVSTEDVPILVRVHSECLTGDVFGSNRCDCGAQLQTAMAKVAQQGCGVILYMRQEGRGIGLVNKLKTYGLQDKGFDTIEANAMLGFQPDLRDYGVGAQILVDLGLKDIRLLTNNPKKIVGLEGYGLKVVERIPIETEPTSANSIYLRTKKEKLGHMINNV